MCRAVARFLLLISLLSPAETFAKNELDEWYKRPIKTVEDRIAETRAAFVGGIGGDLRNRGLPYAPNAVTVVFFKDQKILHIYAGNSRRELFYIKSFKVQGASGTFGPKVRENDFQVPEGIYTLDALNPNSSFYLSMRVSYPNSQDIYWAKPENRRRMGYDIFIHGSSGSVGCIAVGDEAIAELFHLAAITDYTQWKLLLAPVDFRAEPFPIEPMKRNPWVYYRYKELKAELTKLPTVPDILTSQNENH